MSEIKVGDTFVDSKHPGRVFVCEEKKEGRLWDGRAGYLETNCTRVRVTIRPIKTRKVKLMAWLKAQPDHYYRFNNTAIGDQRAFVSVTVGREHVETYAATLPAVVREVRRQLRAKGVKL